MTKAQWSRFCGRLLGYINDYYCSFIKTDYEIDLDLDMNEIITELQNSTSIEDLSPQLKSVAEQYMKSILE